MKFSKPISAFLLICASALAPRSASAISPDCQNQVNLYGDGVQPRNIANGCLDVYAAVASSSQKLQIGPILWVGTSNILFRKSNLTGERKPLYEIIAGNSTQLKNVSSIKLSSDGRTILVTDSRRVLTFSAVRFGNVAPISVTPLNSAIH